jgi:hypothetical protein
VGQPKRVIMACSRLIFAAYLGALIAGPSPWGFAGVLAGESHPNLAQPFLVALPVLAWTLTGVIGGRKMGPIAAVLGFVYMDWDLIGTFLHEIPSHHYSPTLSAISMGWRVCVAIAVILAFPATLSIIGAAISRNWRISKAISNWRYLPVLPLICLFMLTYTLTLGPSIALRSMQRAFPDGWSTDERQIKSYPAGVYIAVDGIACDDDYDFPDTYYTDPTGLVFLFKCNLD